MKFTYYGHSCFAVETGGKSLLFDPFITPNELAAHIRLDAIRADAILITHGHFDHIHDAVELAKSTDATVIANFEICQWLGGKGLEKTVPLNHGGSMALDFGRVKFVNAVHSSVLPDGTYGGNPGGFVVENDEGAFYAAGDTALTLDMKLIGEEFDLRFAALPIGDCFTMGARDAAKAAGFIDCKTIFGIHYDTFPPIKIDHNAAKETFLAAGAELHLPAIGETVEA